VMVAFGWGELVCNSSRNSSVPHCKFLEHIIYLRRTKKYPHWKAD